MSDKYMNFVDLMLRRQSLPALKLTAPGPSADEVTAILKTAVSVSDHGNLQPWRFVVLQGEGKLKYLRAVERVFTEEKPNPDKLDKMRRMIPGTPLIIVSIFSPDTKAKISQNEQLLSCGASCQNIILSAYALGYYSQWLTGLPAESPSVREFFKCSLMSRLPELSISVLRLKSRTGKKKFIRINSFPKKTMADNPEDFIEEIKDDPFEEALRKMQQGDIPDPKQQAEDPKEEIQQPVTEAEKARNLDLLLDLQVEVTMEIGRSRMLISDLLLLGQSSVIELDRLVGDDLDIMIGDKKIGKAEVVISQEKFGGRIKKIHSPRQRLNAINGR
ncbi:hypothetical protein CHS0354_027383 [Potamilus streckersoni]|uniref:Flagellar motor switch protein FliN-like C-terminal domain-containing protein n=1 Tax=Potamilus streckersoni TaxID=2493646 RepID=A0AAE0VZ69_9BIVA|nr:hypothetical protein CHS0354_027383 [Potamilus streckersoni]